jgi:hypothetical protein
VTLLIVHDAAQLGMKMQQELDICAGVGFSAALQILKD